MIDWLGVGHLFELSATEAIAGFFTPLAIFLLFFLAQLILPARRVTGYVINPATGQPRNYRLNGLIVYVLALAVWAFALEPLGMSRDWFYRSTIYAIAGGTVFCFLFSLWAFFSQPPGEIKNPFVAFWEGRSLEFSFFKERFDFKMYLYVVGGTMLVLNALSGAAWHYDQFGSDFNPGVFLYAAFLTFYVLDYFIFERVQLYTYDLIHEKLGFKLIWGGLVVYGWFYIVPLWGMAAHPNPGFSPGLDLRLAHRNRRLVPGGVGHLPGRQYAEIHLQALARPQVPRHHRAEVHRGRPAQNPVQRPVGLRPPLQLPGRGVRVLLHRAGLRLLRQPLGLDLLRLHRLPVHLAAAAGRLQLRREIRRRKVGRVSGPGEVPDFARDLLMRGGALNAGFGRRAGSEVDQMLEMPLPCTPSET